MPDDLTITEQYAALMDRILRAASEGDLLALIPAILAYTQGSPREDFGEAWIQRWLAVSDQPVPESLLPT